MVSSVSNNSSNNSTIIPQVLLTGAGIGIGGKLIGREINAKEVLAADKFELSEDTVKKLTPEQTKCYESIKSLKEISKDPEYTKFKEDSAEELFGKDKKEISVKDFLKDTTTDAIKEEISTGEKEIKELTEKLGKETVKDVQNSIKSEINVQKILNESNKTILSLAENAKDGKITKEVYTKSMEGLGEKANTSTIKMLLEDLKGLLPKKFSWGKAGIGAAIGLAAGALISGMISPKKEA